MSGFFGARTPARDPNACRSTLLRRILSSAIDALAHWNAAIEGGYAVERRCFASQEDETVAKFHNVVSPAVGSALLFAAWSGHTPAHIEAAQADTVLPQQSVGFDRGWGVNVNLFGEVHAGDTIHTFLSELGVGLVRFDLNKPEIESSHGWAAARVVGTGQQPVLRAVWLDAATVAGCRAQLPGPDH